MHLLVKINIKHKMLKEGKQNYLFSRENFSRENPIVLEERANTNNELIEVSTHNCLFYRELEKIKSEYEVENKKLKEEYENKQNNFINNALTKFIVKNMNQSLQRYLNTGNVVFSEYGFKIMGDKNFGDCVKLKHLINALSNNSELSLYFKALQSANPYIKFNCSYEINHVKTIKSLNDEQDEVAMNSVLEWCHLNINLSFIEFCFAVRANV